MMKFRFNNIFNSNLKNKINTIYNTYGLKTQKLKLIEECSELIKEIAKNDGENMAKEMADVFIVAYGILLNNPYLKDILKKEIKFKVNRQIERIERTRFTSTSS